MPLALKERDKRCFLLPLRRASGDRHPVPRHRCRRNMHERRTPGEVWHGGGGVPGIRDVIARRRQVFQPEVP